MQWANITHDSWVIKQSFPNKRTGLAQLADKGAGAPASLRSSVAHAGVSWCFFFFYYSRRGKSLIQKKKTFPNKKSSKPVRPPATQTNGKVNTGTLHDQQNHSTHVTSPVKMAHSSTSMMNRITQRHAETHAPCLLAGLRNRKISISQNDPSLHV